MKSYSIQDFFLEKWYWMTGESLKKKYGLIDMNEALPKSVQLNGKLPNHLFIGATEKIGFSALKQATLIGGPCIMDCFEDFTLESIIDMCMILKTAKTLNIPALVFVGTDEEQFRTNTDWRAVGTRFEKACQQIGKKLEYPHFRVIRSDQAKIKKASKYFMNSIRSFSSIQEMADLYRIGKWTAKKEIGNTGDIKSVTAEVHRRVLATYLPSFVQKITDTKKTPFVIAVENIQQVNAVRKAREISAKMNTFSNGPFQLAYLPVPNLDGTSRMYRSIPSGKIFLSENPLHLEKALKKIPSPVFEYYSTVWPTEFLNEPIKTRQDLFFFIKNLKEEILAE